MLFCHWLSSQVGLTGSQHPVLSVGDEDDDAALIDIDSEVQNGGIIYDEIESGKSGFVRSCCANIPKGTYFLKTS